LILPQLSRVYPNGASPSTDKGLKYSNSRYWNSNLAEDASKRVNTFWSSI